MSETAAPRSRRLLQITGRVLQLAERNPEAIRIVPPPGILIRASPRSGIGVPVAAAHFTAKTSCRVTVLT